MKFKSRWLTADFHNSSDAQVNILPYLFTPSIAARTAFKDTRVQKETPSPDLLLDFSGGFCLGRGASEQWSAHACDQI